MAIDTVYQNVVVTNCDRDGLYEVIVYDDESEKIFGGKCRRFDIELFSPLRAGDAAYEGYYVDAIDNGNERYHLIVAPKALGEAQMSWRKALNWCKSLRIGNCHDWVMPTSDELALIAQKLGSRVTRATLFKENGSEMFGVPNYGVSDYWSTTESSTNTYAMVQNVNYSIGQMPYLKATKHLSVRAVRRVYF